MKKRVLMLALATSLLVGNTTVGVNAETEGETDYSYLEDMSIKELKALDEAIHELLGDAPVIDITEEEVTEEVITIEETEVKVMNEDEFFDDLLNSYSARAVVSEKYTAAEQSMMTNDEAIAFSEELVNAEIQLMEKYKDAMFEDLNIQYLCTQYINGLEKQKEACEVYKNSKDILSFNNIWTSGYSNRSYVIVELAEYYDIAFPANAVAEMKIQTDALDSLNEAETRNASVPSATVKQVQQLLHDIGFKCWNIDGVAGKRTVKAIKRFQEMYGYEIDGMIDDELIQQLTDVKADKES